MAFWANALAWLNNTPTPDGVTPNDNGPAEFNAGDPSGVEYENWEPIQGRALPSLRASGWDGWPTGWSTPNWGATGGSPGLNGLIDTAWNAIDLNSSILSAMPVYRTRAGKIIPPQMWMTNPDPSIYTSWQEFCKQLFWDYHLGEAFVLPMSHYADKTPMNFRVVPPWLINVELISGSRVYSLGSQDVTGEILHIRYQSSTIDARGHGPLEVAGARMTQIGLLQRYAQNLIETGGTPHYWISVERRLNPTEAAEALKQWLVSRSQNPGQPALLSGGATLNQTQSMSAKDMALLELEQFNESRIAVALGVHPSLLGLPAGGDSMTYKNQEGIYDYHDRSSLKPKAIAVMSALSGWALPYGQCVELNRDEYTRGTFKERAEAYAILAAIVDADGRPALTVDEIRAAERLSGPQSAVSLTGGDDTSSAEYAPPTGGDYL